MQQNEPPLEMPAQLEHLPVMAYVDEVDRDGRTTMVFLSGRHEEIIGYGLADFPAGGSEWDECIHPDDLAHYLEHFRGAWRDQEPLQVTYRFRRKDDAWIWIEERGMPAYDQARGLTVISGVVFDITAHHAEDVRLEATALGLRRDLDESQRDLAERVANYHSLFQTVDDMVLVCDMEGRVVESNPAAMHMTGYTAEELRGKSVIDLHPGGDAGGGSRDHRGHARRPRVGLRAAPVLGGRLGDPHRDARLARQLGRQAVHLRRLARPARGARGYGPVRPYVPRQSRIDGGQAARMGLIAASR